MSDWQPIETAPKDGTVILVYSPEAVDVDEHVRRWPERSTLNVVQARWCAPQYPDEEGGWYAPMFSLYFGPWDDPSTDIDPVDVTPTHWQPLPAPPEAGR